MWNDTVTLFVDDNSIRLMVNRGSQVKKWADLKLEAGLIKNSIVVQEAEVAARIKQLFKNQKVNAKKVILGFSGLHTLTRPATLPQLPKAMLPEAVGREASRVLPVPLDQLYLSWRAIPSSKGRVQIFIAAIPRKTADSLLRTLRIAGLTPSRMMVKPLILTKSAPVNTCILVDVQPAEFDIVIMNNGVPQPVRTVTLPVDEISWEQKLNLMSSDIDRTIKFYDTNNPEKPLNSNLPIFVSGDLMGKSELQKALSEKVNRPVKEASIALKGTGLLDIGRHMINIAMSVKANPAGGDHSFPVANMNLLPAPYQPKPMSMTRVVGIPGTVAIIGVIVPMVMLMQSSSANIESLQNDIVTANKITNQKTAQRAEVEKSVNELKGKLAAVQATYDKFQNSVNKLKTSQEMVEGDLIATLNRAYMNITLNSINESGGNLTISGSAPQEIDVINYATDMDLTGRFSLTTISSIKIIPPKDENSEGHVEFTLSLQRKG